MLFKPEEFENAGFAFSCGRRTFLKNGDFPKRRCRDNPVISLSEYFSNMNPKWPVNVAFLNSSGAVWTENI